MCFNAAVQKTVLQAYFGVMALKVLIKSSYVVSTGMSACTWITIGNCHMYTNELSKHSTMYNMGMCTVNQSSAKLTSTST